jgi:hypothetical protein
LRCVVERESDLFFEFKVYHIVFLPGLSKLWRWIFFKALNFVRVLPPNCRELQIAPTPNTIFAQLEANVIFFFFFFFFF